LPEQEFSEETQEVAVKHESQVLFRIHLLFAVFQRFSRTPVTFIPYFPAEALTAVTVVEMKVHRCNPVAVDNQRRIVPA